MITSPTEVREHRSQWSDAAGLIQRYRFEARLASKNLWCIDSVDLATRSSTVSFVPPKRFSNGSVETLLKDTVFVASQLRPLHHSLHRDRPGQCHPLCLLSHILHVAKHLRLVVVSVCFVGLVPTLQDLRCAVSCANRDEYIRAVQRGFCASKSGEATAGISPAVTTRSFSVSSSCIS